jgi:cephalosporin hydroxylase
MHYKNGRPANPGDKIVHLPTGQSGILHSPNAQSNTCNARLAEIKQTDPWITVGECLHIDDIAAASIPDASAVQTVDSPPAE